MKIIRIFLILMFAVAAMMPLASMAPVAARQKDSQVRTVHGGVLDKSDNIVNGGVVYLQNKKTQVIRTYISDQDGQYTFSGLDPNVDYDIHAELNGLTSVVKTISSFDSRKEIVLSLKLDRKKADK
jgi:Carboxypeptidase regulatory-like domain